MTTQKLPTFIVECPTCKARVAAEQHGRISQPGGQDEFGEEYYGVSVVLGCCPQCKSILVGESQQTAIGGYDAREDEWADVDRVYPDPPKVFESSRIPKVVSNSISQGLIALQGNAGDAACVMFGRALEAICRDLLEQSPPPAEEQNTTPAKQKPPIMLGAGIRKLKEEGLIDQMLYEWSQELHAFRNLGAHPTDRPISCEEADDLRIFVFAIVDYIYDLTDRYNEFKKRKERNLKKSEIMEEFRQMGKVRY